MNNLYLIIGPSGSGKTELANGLAKKYYLTPVESYTTRPPRYPDELGHIFVTEEHFNALGEMCAYTEYNGHQYGVTKNILDASDIYVIDTDGACYLFDRYSGKHLYYIWLDTSPQVCYERMISRGDEETAAVDRVKERSANLLLFLRTLNRKQKRFLRAARRKALISVGLRKFERRKIYYEKVHCYYSCYGYVCWSCMRLR